MEGQPAKHRVNRLQTTALMNKIVSRHWESLRRAKEEGLPVVWSFGLLSLLVRAVGIPVHNYGSYASLAARDAGSDPMLDEAEAEGYLPETCSYLRLHLGLLAALRKGKPVREDMRLPMPDLVISSMFCPEQPYIANAIHRQYGIPVVCVNTPLYHGDPDLLERAVPYVEQGLREDIIPAIERLTGKPYDYDRLSESLAHLKKCAQIRNQCLELSRNIPTPWSLFDICVSSGALQNVGGTPEAVDYSEKLLAELKERVSQGTGSMAEERYRLLYDASFMMWRWFGPLSRKLASVGACLVTSRYPTFLWAYADDIDPDRPLYSYARESLRAADWKTPEVGHRYTAEAVKRYSIDGILAISPRTCRHVGALPDLITDMERECGVPGVIVDADQIDPRFFSEAQMDTRIEALLEMIDARRERQG